MAIITGNGQDNTGSNLNAGMSNTQQQQQQNTQNAPMGAGAVTSTGQQASGQGGGGGATSPGANAPKQAGSGQYTNFNNYTQNNQKNASNLNNALSTNFQQQGQQAQNTISNATNSVAQGVQSENDRITQGLNTINSDATGGDFSNLLVPQSSTSGVNTTGVQGAATNANPGTSNVTASQNTQSNPINMNLVDWATQLATGATNATNIQNAANTQLNTATNQIGNLQTNQGLLQTTPGVGTLLQNILGGRGTYTQGSNALDQALVTGNSGNYTNLLNNANTQLSSAQAALANGQQLTTDQINALNTNAQQAQQNVQDLSNTNLNTLNSDLTSTAAQDQANRQAAQASILNQFNTENFDQTTANQLGIGNNAILFNVLKTNNQNYSNTPSNFQDTSYLGLNREVVGAGDVINNQQLTNYSALQKLLGNNNSSAYAYQNTGNIANGTAQDYNINGKVFDQALANAYGSAINQANNTNLNGVGYINSTPGLNGSQGGIALAGLNVNKNAGSLVDTGALSQLQSYYQSLAKGGTTNSNVASLNPLRSAQDLNSIANSGFSGDAVSQQLLQGLNGGYGVTNGNASVDPSLNAGTNGWGIANKLINIGGQGAAGVNYVGQGGSTVAGDITKGTGDTFTGDNIQNNVSNLQNATIDNLLNNLKNYEQQQGYMDVAKVGPVRAAGIPSNLNNLLSNG